MTVKIKLKKKNRRVENIVIENIQRKKKIKVGVKKKRPLSPSSVTASGSASASASNIESSLREKFVYYPEITDDDFYERIYTKKEFRAYEMKERVKEGCNPKEFFPKPYQQFLRNFISPNTPYNGLLLVHGTGSGKTCTSIHIAESFKEIVKRLGKKIIIITTLPKNFQKELFNPIKDMRKQNPEDIVQCTGREYEVVGKDQKYLTREQKMKEVSKKIHSYYEFFGYKEFANYIMKSTNGWKGDEEEITPAILNFLAKKFNDNILIIDEVQNIKTDVSDKLKKSIQPILQSVIKHSQNLKLLLMSATPMFDREDEIIFLINLLLRNDGRPELNKDDIFYRDRTLKPGADEILKESFKGYISYIRGENPNSFPMKFYPENATVPKMIYHMNGERIDPEKQLKYTPIIQCPMKGIQYDTYVNQFEKIMKGRRVNANQEEIDEPGEALESGEAEESGSVEASASSSSSEENENTVAEETKHNKVEEEMGGMRLYKDLSYISNIVFPVADSPIGTYDKTGYRETDDGEGGLYRVVREGRRKNMVKFRYQSHALFDAGTKAEAPFLDRKHLENYSTKFTQVYDSIVNSTGLNIVYSGAIDSGALAFALMLEQNGFVRYTTETETDLLEYPANRLGGGGKRRQICYKCGQVANHENHTESRSANYHPYRVAKYILYFGEQRDIIKVGKEDALNHFSAGNNRYGEEIKVFIGTLAISEGLDFKMIRQIHILEPWYNLSRHEQIIGRGIRNCSHIDLPKEERNCVIHQYAVSYSEGKGKGKEKVKAGRGKAGVGVGVGSYSQQRETIDLRNYRIAENKDITIKKITRLMKMSAIDCLLFKKHNVILEGPSDEKVVQILPDGSRIRVSYADKPFSALCDYMGNCDYPCTWNPDPKKKYPINSDTYNINFGKQNVEIAKHHIKTLFHQGFDYVLRDIEEHVKSKMDLDEMFVYKALDEMVDNKQEVVLDMYKRRGYIIYRGDHYIYQPFDISREDTPMLYRTVPQPYSPAKVDLNNYTFDYGEEVENAVPDPRRGVNTMSNSEKEHFFHQTMQVLQKAYQDHTFVTFTKGSSSFRSSRTYDNAVTGYVIEKLGERHHLFMHVFLKHYVQKRVKGEEMGEWMEKILTYLYKKLLFMDRDVEPVKKRGQGKGHGMDHCIGYEYENKYYVIPGITEKTTMATLSYKKVKLTQFRVDVASKELSYKISKIREIQERSNRASSSRSTSVPKNLIYGKMEWDRKKQHRIFMIVDKSVEENVVTKAGKKSGRAIIKGRVCSTFQISRLQGICEKLGISETHLKSSIPPLCATIEIFLRWKHQNEKETLQYFIG